MKRRNSKFLLLLLSTCMLCGCGSTSSSEAEKIQSETKSETVISEESEAEASSEPEETEETPSSSIVSIVSSDIVESEAGDAYLLPDSDSRYLTEEDIEGMSSDEIRLAKNEIFARHGRKFNDSELQKYFDSQSWYEGKYDPDTFDSKHASELNKYETANVQFLADHQSGSNASGSSSSGNSSKGSSSYADFSATYKEICEYGFIEYAGYDRISELFFQLDYSSTKDCGDYCEVQCELQKPVIIKDELSEGESYTFTSNELTNEKMTVTMGSDDILSGSDGEEYYIDGNGYLMYEYGSEDAYWVPFYNGTVRIYEGAPLGYFMDPENTFSASYSGGDGYDWLNGLNFDSDGYVTAMLFIGD